jgi:hypothetical protein
METQEYEIVIVGTGEGAKFLAWTLARQGRRVAVIERKYIGGSCPNIACLPSKNVIHSAKLASYFRRSEEFGISKEGFEIDMSAVRDRKRRMVTGLVDIHVANFRSSGAELIMGSAKFTGPKRLEVPLNEGGTRVVQGEKIVIGTGTHAAIAVVDRPVLDRTGLTGRYDFGLIWRPEVPLGGPGNNPTLPADMESREDIDTAIQQEVGLKLEAAKTSTEVIVIDHKPLGGRIVRN